MEWRANALIFFGLSCVQYLEEHFFTYVIKPYQNIQTAQKNTDFS